MRINPGDNGIRIYKNVAVVRKNRSQKSVFTNLVQKQIPRDIQEPLKKLS